MKKNRLKNENGETVTETVTVGQLDWPTARWLCASLGVDWDRATSFTITADGLDAAVVVAEYVVLED